MCVYVCERETETEKQQGARMRVGGWLLPLKEILEATSTLVEPQRLEWKN